MKTLKVYVDFKQQTDESNSKRADNTLTLPLTISEKSASSSNNENTDDALLFGPNLSLTLGVYHLFQLFTDVKNSFLELTRFYIRPILEVNPEPDIF